MGARRCAGQYGAGAAVSGEVVCYPLRTLFVKTGPGFAAAVELGDKSAIRRCKKVEVEFEPRSLSDSSTGQEMKVGRNNSRGRDASLSEKVSGYVDTMW